MAKKELPLQNTTTDPALIRRFEVNPDLIDRKSVYLALTSCQTQEEMRVLIDHLLAEPEIESIKDRWNIAQTILATNCSIRMATEYHGGDRAKVARVAKELTDKKPLGYRLAYKRICGLPRDEEVVDDQ